MGVGRLKNLTRVQTVIRVGIVPPGHGRVRKTDRRGRTGKGVFGLDVCAVEENCAWLFSTATDPISCVTLSGVGTGAPVNLQAESPRPTLRDLLTNICSVATRLRQSIAKRKTGSAVLRARKKTKIHRSLPAADRKTAVSACYLEGRLT